jgi:hypothetical protein
MSSYLVISVENIPVMSFDDRMVAIEWCKSQPKGQRYKVVMLPNENGKMPETNVGTLNPVFVS